MSWFARFYLDKEKDMIVDLDLEGEQMTFTLSTPNHGTGNLIRNLAKLCSLPLCEDAHGLLVIRGSVPCYIDGYNRMVYIFRLGDTKVANIHPDGQIEMKAHIPAISKTLMSQTKEYRLDIRKTIVKTYIRNELKFHTDLHTHMNANLSADILIALGICHQIRYPLYYIKKLGLRCSLSQTERLCRMRRITEEQYKDSTLTGKYLTRRIDDNTFLNFADLLLNDPEDAAFNIPRIRRSLTILKDGQAVFTNLEKVYLYRYVFTKGQRDEQPVRVTPELAETIPDLQIRQTVLRILKDRESPAYRNNTLFQDKLLWIARSYAAVGVRYAEIADTTLVKPGLAQTMLKEVHEVMPAVTQETGVLLRFLAAIRRIPLTIVKDQVVTGDYFRENLETLSVIASDPYVAGSDIIGEELNDIRDIRPVIREIVRIAAADPSFVIRIHAGENDSLRDNVANSLLCVKESLQPGQTMPQVRIGHGLYTANLKQKKGEELVRLLLACRAVLEFQITSNVRLNNLSDMKNHPLRQYLQRGVECVQGTDGGALYGTDSIDEQLSLEKMLGLSDAEQRQMRMCEDRILSRSLRAFEQKTRRQEEGAVCPRPAAESRIRLTGNRSLPAAQVLSERICPLPEEGLPVVVVGGSFNSSNHRTVVREEEKRIIDVMLEQGDPREQYFVIGHSLCGYEKYLVERNRGRYRIFAMVPGMLTRPEYRRLRESGVSVRVSVETVPLGIYKSLAYEVFKRRPSVLAAFDGNSAGANMIQEARNSKYPCRIFVNPRSSVLRAKAESLKGYIRFFDLEDPQQFIRCVRDLRAERQTGISDRNS